VLGALEWAQVRALGADGFTQREIARQLGINRRTVARMLASEVPPRYRRAPAGSQLDRFEPVLRRLLEEWPQIKAPRATEVLREYGYAGSVDVVRRRLRELRPREVRPAQRTGYRPGLVLQLDWTEMPTRPTIAGRERRVYALVASLPYSGAQTAFFSFEMTIESFLEGHARAFEWLEGVPRECVYDNLRSVVARRERAGIVWNARFLHLRGHYAFHATACTLAMPREKGSVEAAVRYLKTGFWPARRFRQPGRARLAVRRLARRGLQPTPARERPLPGRAAARGGAARSAAAAAGALRLVSRARGAGAGRRLPARRRLLLPCARLASAAAGRVARQSRRGLDPRARDHRRDLPALATSLAPVEGDRRFASSAKTQSPAFGRPLASRYALRNEDRRRPTGRPRRLAGNR
jgi:transposase